MIKPFAGPPCGGFLRRDRMTGTRRSAEGRLYLCKNEWDMETEWDLIVRLCVAGLCGTVIGLDREYRVKDAGFRTHFLVALGSALMMIVSQYGFEGFLATHGGLGRRRTMIVFSAQKKEFIDAMFARLESKDYSVISYEVETQRTSDGVVHRATIVIRAKGQASEEGYIDLLRENPDITVERVV